MSKTADVVDEVFLTLDSLVHEYGEACLSRDPVRIARSRELFRTCMRDIVETLVRLEQAARGET